MNIVTSLAEKKAKQIYSKFLKTNVKQLEQQSHYFLKEYDKKLNFFLTNDQIIKIADSESKLNNENPVEFIYLVVIDLIKYNHFKGYITDANIEHIISKFK